MKFFGSLELVFIFLISFYFSNAQTDSTYLSLKDAKKIKNKENITKIELGKEVVKRKTIPAHLKKFVNLENLSLNPKMKSWGIPVDEKHHLLNKFPSVNRNPFINRFHMFNRIHLFSRDKSKLRKFPSWIKNMRSLKEIDLSGNKKFRYKKELKKIKNLQSLQELTIEPKNLDQDLIKILSEFRQLKDLEIKYKSNENQDDFFDELKINLPGVNIIFSLDL